MSTTRSDLRASVLRRSRAVPPTLAVALAVTVAGCGSSDPRTAATMDEPSAATAGATGSAAAVGGGGVGPGGLGGPSSDLPSGAPISVDPALGGVLDAPDVVADVSEVLARRAAALRARDLASYRRGLLAGDSAFSAQQEQYAANLTQLPLQAYDLVPDPATLVRDGTSYWVNVAVSMQLQGFDATPVTTVDRYRFTPGRAGAGRLRLSSVTDAAWEQRNGVRPQPWDVEALTVRAGAGVLGIFDAAGAAAAGPLVASLEAGVADVAARVPYEWARTVTVLALSDPSWFDEVATQPGAEVGARPEDLDALAFTVSARPDVAEVAATRLVLQPRLLSEPGPARDRLLRHELTHVAVGAADDHVPVWLAEGVAEWTSVQALAPTDRVVARPARKAARAGFTDLPTDAGFHTGADTASVDYAQSWWACEYLASVAGPSAPWSVLDQLEAASVATGGLDRAAEDVVLTGVAGVNMRTLARKAGKLLLASLKPTPVPVPDPAATAAPIAPAVSPTVPAV